MVLILHSSDGGWPGGFRETHKNSSGVSHTASRGSTAVEFELVQELYSSVCGSSFPSGLTIYCGWASCCSNMFFGGPQEIGSRVGSVI